ncbi:MAG TPA: NAD(P)H-dependent oxidoreductase, partial [Phenylobacterium sp.]|nr:NAD(P)H-dependent oxidoreductase [Phenylobacterium sp.]
MASRGLVVFAHPNPASLTAALARAAYDGLRAGGLPSRLVDLHREGFDPVMTMREAAGHAADDPIVTGMIDDLKGAAVLIVIHPNCWGAPPAMMKGWMDRVFAPGAAYAFEKGTDAGDVPAPRLGLRHAIVVNTSNTAEDREARDFGDPLERIWRDCLLRYCSNADVERLVLRIV